MNAEYETAVDRRREARERAEAAREAAMRKLDDGPLLADAHESAMSVRINLHAADEAVQLEANSEQKEQTDGVPG
jgi:hypothetical protein